MALANCQDNLTNHLGILQWTGSGSSNAPKSVNVNRNLSVYYVISLLNPDHA